jgi:hypothetical protein
LSIVRVVLSIFLFAFSAQGQEQRLAHPSPTPGETCTVEGETVKATTGEGLKKMTVQLFSMERGGEPLSTLTDANGRFVFSGVEPGGYSLMASGNGYPSQRYGQRGRFDAGKILKLTPGRTEKDIVFRLQPPGVITGTIYDEDGGPAVRAQVQAVRSVRQGSRHVFMPAMGAQTDDRGEYRIFGLEPDQYLVVAACQRLQVAPSDPGDGCGLDSETRTTRTEANVTICKPDGGLYAKLDLDDVARATTPLAGYNRARSKLGHP